MQNKKVVLVDMDNVLVDFQSGIDRLSDEVKREYEGRLDEVPGVFSLMDPLQGAVDAIDRLSKVYDLYILSTAPWKNATAWSDKNLWVRKYFGEVFHKRIFLTHRKDMVMGDYLIDDRTKHGAGNFKGTRIHFGVDVPEGDAVACKDWDAVLRYLLPGSNE